MSIKKEHYWIRPKKKLLEFQIGLFEREIKRVTKNYRKLYDNRELRKKAFKPKFESMAELKEAYVDGLITDYKEYRSQQRAIWCVYSDRGNEDKLEWLYNEKAKYELQLLALEQILKSIRLNTQKKAERNKKRHRKRGLYQKTIDRLEEERREAERIAEEEKRHQEEMDRIEQRKHDDE